MYRSDLWRDVIHLQESVKLLIDLLAVEKDHG